MSPGYLVLEVPRPEREREVERDERPQVGREHRAHDAQRDRQQPVCHHAEVDGAVRPCPQGQVQEPRGQAPLAVRYRG